MKGFTAVGVMTVDKCAGEGDFAVSLYSYWPEHFKGLEVARNAVDGIYEDC